jgi:predicted Co/Zn/Cd cation transporter (cation efflux family)
MLHTPLCPILKKDRNSSNANRKNEIIENKALRVGVIVNLIMTFAGWITFYFSNSEAILLDGNFYLISAIATIIAIIISNNKHQRTILFTYA